MNFFGICYAVVSLSCLTATAQPADSCEFTAPGASTPVGTRFGRLPMMELDDSMDVAWASNLSPVDLYLVQQISDSSDAASNTQFLHSSTLDQLSWAVGRNTSFNFTESENGPVYYWTISKANGTGSSCTSELFRITPKPDTVASSSTADAKPSATSSVAWLPTDPPSTLPSTVPVTPVPAAGALGLELGLGIGLGVPLCIAMIAGLWLWTRSRASQAASAPNDDLQPVWRFISTKGTETSRLGDDNVLASSTNTSAYEFDSDVASAPARHDVHRYRVV